MKFKQAIAIALASGAFALPMASQAQGVDSATVAYVGVGALAVAAIAGATGSSTSGTSGTSGTTGTN